ncbi:PREDICTED: uncharacterized protein LOC108378337 [Rhagoletis zephyria]|uniref:uncharacterized protein LOC108378337 n=1 Tax=Rhagoletis zephyria TaxID=28612 RepID=UPI0008118F36|nr:PREDICTED: uncharacterized protein LOC108378337 [Rhagoletis zephyria]XP_017490125.1 PREDICTED: uncharacterized protein LOC108378337 [Rhagoletis zephyria]
MSSYSFHGTSKTWTPRDEFESQQITAADSKQVYNDCSLQDISCELDNEKWSVKQLTCLLRLYGAHRCLWDTCHPDNRNRKLRKAALIDITAAMGDGVTFAQVLQKINVLRATYRYEKRRIKQRIRRGIGAKTKLKWFAIADSFLRKVPRTEKNKKTEDDNSDSDLEEAIVITVDSETLIPSENDALAQYLDVDIKMEPEEEHASETNKSYPGNASYLPAKTGGSFTIAGENALIEQRKWTTHESLQFVFLLRSYPLLWQLTLGDETEIEQQSFVQVKALEEISRTMQLPKHRLLKRLQIFLSTYRLEIAKIKEDSAYKPDFVWWPMVQEYLDTPKLESVNAIESHADCSQPAHNASEPIDGSSFDTSSFKPTFGFPLSASASPAVSPICSPPPINEDSNSMSGCPFTEHQNFSKPPMKLIWNGLEDNLLEGKWSLKHSVKFLRLYGAHRCLWDLNDSDYRSREMRTAAIEDIAAAMGYGLDAEYVAKKIKIFRITYMQHRKRMLEAIKENREPDIQLRWFPLADSFLRPHIGLRSIKEQEREMPQFDFQYVYANLNLIDPGLLADLK